MRKVKSKLPYGSKFYLIDEYKTLYLNGRRFMIRHCIKNKRSCYFAEELGEYGNTCRVWGSFNNPRSALRRIKGICNAGYTCECFGKSFSSRVMLDIKEDK